MNRRTENFIDPDPFLIAGLCLQGAAVILQLVQIAQHHKGSKTAPGSLGQRFNTLEQLESTLESFDKAISKTEKFVRRNSSAPDKEMYNVSFKISLGVLNFSATAAQEYHNNLADITSNLSNFTRWIGHIIAHDPDMAAQLGDDILQSVNNSSKRLNEMIGSGATIEVFLSEAKLVREACRMAIDSRLNDKAN